MEIHDEDGYGALATLTDTSTPLERRLDGVVELMWTKAVELQVRRKMREEDHQRWEEQRQQKYELERKRDKQLERLKKTEELANQWERAARLRAYAAAINAAAVDTLDSEDAAEIAWIQNAADWLDPLVRKRWPDVDIG
jgi:hypothetical protein